MKIITLFIILIFNIIGAFGQNLIGYNDMEIKKYMQENHKEMNFNNVTNTRYKYLKYTDNYDMQTLLFFLDPNSICYSMRLICDSSIKEEKVKEFNSIYKISGENKWIDTRNGQDYFVEISDERWSCVINIVPKK
jgi:hypothetical protein